MSLGTRCVGVFLERIRAPNKSPCLWPEPYNENTPEAAIRFLFECCWTYNEADRSVELIPDKQYIRFIAEEWHSCRLAGRPLIIEKSRRMIVSWVLRGLELWSLGLRSEKCVLCGLTYPKAAEHIWRIWWLYDQLRRHRREFALQKCCTRGGSTDAQQIHQVILPNGSVMESLNQQGESFQGSGYAAVTMEEFSHYRACEYMYGQALRVTQGKPGCPGGQLTIVTNASTNTEWQEIKRCRETVNPNLSMQLLRAYNGASYVRAHYSADPEKNGAWLLEQRPATPSREWAREMEMREDVWDGQPVYPNYRDDWHCASSLSRAMRHIDDAEYFGGWDCGATLRPAFVLLRLCPKPFPIRALLEVTSIGGESMEDFAPRVLKRLMEWHGGLWDDVKHFGDATVETRNGATGLTARDIAKKHGIDIVPVSNAWAPRYASVCWALNRNIDETTPGFLIAAETCPLLRAGFQGAYKFRESASGENSGPGSVLLDPLKNMYSHVHDALQYPMVKIRKRVEGGGAKLHRLEEEY